MSKTHLEVYSIRNYLTKEKDEKSFWTRVGTAYENKDNSYNLLLDFIPMPDKDTGRVHLHMRLPRAKDEQSKGQNTQTSPMDENINFSNDYPFDYSIEEL